MKVVFFSLTGNVRRFVRNLGLPNIELDQTNPFIEMNEEFVLIAPAYEPEVTDIAWDFMETSDNVEYCRGVIGSGNVNFDSLYIYTAKDLAKDFSIPLLGAFELFGTDKDIENTRRLLSEITSSSQETTRD